MKDWYCAVAFVAFLVFLLALIAMWRSIGPKALPWQQLYVYWREGQKEFVLLHFVDSLFTRALAKSLLTAIALGGFTCVGGLCGWEGELFDFARDVLTIVERHLK